MNFIENAAKQAAEIVRKAYKTAIEQGKLKEVPLENIPVEVPKDTSFGDYSSSIAMQTAKLQGKSPRDIGTALTECMELEGSYFDSVSIMGAGFINFTLGKAWFSEVITGILDKKENYGKITADKKEKIMVEFVSANPTGPMHMGNARGGVLGDCLAEILSWAGHEVSREFLINDAGNQVEKFAQSLEARYIQYFEGDNAIEFPEDGYHGDDIKTLAALIAEIKGPVYLNMGEKERRAEMIEFGLVKNIEKMKKDLAKYKINYDVWFSESTLHDSGEVENTVRELTANGKTYEKDGAIWLKSTDFGCEKDDVLMRANGFYTYFAADIAYHKNKLATRGFDRAINIWGADHHGHVARIKSALDAIGLNGTDRLEIILMQLVRLMQDGEVVRMSKRTGKSITLSDLLEEIPVDAARFFFNSREANTHLEFDLDLAVREDSENPVYYAQYAHARVQSILRKLAEAGIDTAISGDVDMSSLTSAEEIGLIKGLSKLPEEIRLGARDRDPSRINKFAVSLAADFHKFYNAHRILEAESDVQKARIALCLAVGTTMKNVLSIIGVTAPDKM